MADAKCRAESVGTAVLVLVLVVAGACGPGAHARTGAWALEGVQVVTSRRWLLVGAPTKVRRRTVPARGRARRCPFVVQVGVNRRRRLVIIVERGPASVESRGGSGRVVVPVGDPAYAVGLQLRQPLPANGPAVKVAALPGCPPRGVQRVERRSPSSSRRVVRPAFLPKSGNELVGDHPLCLRVVL